MKYLANLASRSHKKYIGFLIGKPHKYVPNSWSFGSIDHSVAYGNGRCLVVMLRPLEILRQIETVRTAFVYLLAQKKTVL